MTDPRRTLPAAGADRPTTEPRRATCQCGATILPENADNHLLRQSNGPHRIISWPRPATAAGRDLIGFLRPWADQFPEKFLDGWEQHILAIEAEAAQGAAPRAEGLDE